MAHDHEAPSAADMVTSILADLGPELARVGEAPKRHSLPGLGTLYRRGRIWWIRYSLGGHRVRESSKSPRENDAVRLLRKRFEEHGKGRRRDPVSEGRVRMPQLFEALEADYRNNGRRSLATLGFRLAPLQKAFGTDRAVDVTTARITHYAQSRLAAGKSRATVNRELAALRRAFAVAITLEQLTTAPAIKLLAENNVREGFVTATQFAEIVEHLPDYLKDVARFGFLTGWRRREITSLEWRDIDLTAGTISLRREHSKNAQPRTVPFSHRHSEDAGTIFGALGELIARRLQRRTSEGDGACYVFHRHGQQVRDFRGAWATACQAANVPGLLFHDLRRSAVRNLLDAGIDQRLAMAVTGHRTVSVFHRYRIVADGDIRAALRKARAPVDSERNDPLG